MPKHWRVQAPIEAGTRDLCHGGGQWQRRQLAHKSNAMVGNHLRPVLIHAAACCVGGWLWGHSVAHAGGNPNQFIQLLESKHCRQCQLQDSDLVRADLRNADLSGANLEGANLSQANLDGANLQNTNLAKTSLEGASLRGANLVGSNLYGTDLRGSDLTGAKLKTGSLTRAYWQGAVGIQRNILSYAELHNAGVLAASQGRYPEAEMWFAEAIQRQPEAAVSLLARGICRGELGKKEEAASDFDAAASLYQAMGDTTNAELLQKAALSLKEQPKTKSGNGAGSALLGTALSAMQMLAPLAKIGLAAIGL